MFVGNSFEDVQRVEAHPRPQASLSILESVVSKDQETLALPTKGIGHAFLKKLLASRVGPEDDYSDIPDGNIPF